ncbi:N-(5'-phosphoribosyl)anthranilate isomerase [Rhodoplanes elegans]|uniref:N-(5'-phosphoribosyl)anthranilate isomerase n=1 Tax=Rhodoplanes elegans TaxID=29408 RepID=A0A327KJX0_9BRAD|nr:phosphoribosylanthranilate isomerase [Rhodoplanes elegans]MBK5958894.1 N-(5'-phosphoribosyl)anthranilate isomerase [Rhodoplanes elegans]RAI38414.1 phosphoribosylanthranilate isomerase [Rhodoplanes elegans]
MTLVIKICGLKTSEAVEAAAAAGADMVGLVVFPPSPRHVDLAHGRSLAALATGRLQVVALTVDADDALLDDIVAALDPDWLQLHGKETPERVAAVKARFGRPVMKALGIAAAADLARVPAYAAVADRILFDARPPKDATRPGGLGRAFDWDLLDDLDPGLGYMLSGGLDPANVAEALRITRAPAVDVSSGVERAPGDKDPQKIAEFVRAARAAAAAAPAVARPRA